MKPSQVKALLAKNKGRLAQEIRESKELASLLKASTHRKLNAEEKYKVKEQLFDIFKSIPSLTIFLLPGGAILLPLTIKLIPKLLPSAFREESQDNIQLTVMASVKTIKELPTPKGHFLLGHLPQFKANNKHQVLERWAKECGSLFKINFVGKQFIVSTDHEINQEILKQRPDTFQRFFKITEIMEEMGVLGVFNAEGDTWKRHRRLTSNALNLKNVKGFYPVIKNTTSTLLQKWEELATVGPIDVQSELMKYTVDVTTEIAFGHKLDTINDQNDVLQQHLETIFPMINERITAPIPLWRYFKKAKDKKLDQALATIESTIKALIASARAQLKENKVDDNYKPTNYLEALLLAKEDDQQYSDEEIYGNVFTILLAGEDTTSNSIAWTLYYLAQRPALIERIRKEAKEVYNNDSLPDTPNDLSRLKLAHSVAMETLRLKPVTPNLYMQATKDVIIKDLEIKKGMTVMLQNKVAQTQELYFKEAASFHPDRWLTPSCPMHEPHSPDVVKTFGAGARFCPGKNLAMYEMTLCISTLCKHFDFELAVAPNEVKEHFAFTMFPENLKINFKKLNPS